MENGKDNGHTHGALTLLGTVLSFAEKASAADFDCMVANAKVLCLDCALARKEVEMATPYEGDPY